MNYRRKTRISVTIKDGIEYWYDHGELYAIKCTHDRVRCVGRLIMEAAKRRIKLDMIKGQANV